MSYLQYSNLTTIYILNYFPILLSMYSQTSTVLLPAADGHQKGTTVVVVTSHQTHHHHWCGPVAVPLYYKMNINFISRIHYFIVLQRACK